MLLVSRLEVHKSLSSMHRVGSSKNRPHSRRTCWGYSFQLTHDHPTADQLETLKHSCDQLADKVLGRLVTVIQNEYPSTQVNERASNSPYMKIGRHDLYQLLRDNAYSDEDCQELWSELHRVPDCKLKTNLDFI